MVFQIRQTPAAGVAALVERTLSLQGERAEVVIDAQRNRLLVRASGAVRQRVHELVATFDRRPASGGTRADASEDAYATRANVETQPSRNVQASFSAAAKTRSHARRQGAPPPAPWPYNEVQRLVAKPVGGGAQSRETVVETMALPLKHAAAKDLPDRLKSLFGNRLSPLVTTNEDVTSYIIQMPGHTPLEIHIEKDASKVIVRGPAEPARHTARLIEALDAEPLATARRTRVIALRGPGSPYVRQALVAVASKGDRTLSGGSSRLVARLFQPKQAADAEADQAQPNDPPAPRGTPEMNEAMPDEEEDEHGALSGDVEIEQIPDLGAIIVRGSQRDVERVMEIIEEIERLSVETEPVIELYPLKHIGSEAMSDVIEPLYGTELAPRQGRVSITPLIHPNALLLIGRAESVKSLVDLIARLDQPGGPTSQFEVFHLRYATAAVAATTLNTTFGTFNSGLGVRLRVTPDARTNALIVQAGPRDLIEVGKLVKQLDSPGSAAVNELRLFRLRYASAGEVAALLSAAVQAAPQGAQQGAQQGGGQFQQQPGGQRGQGGQGGPPAQFQQQPAAAQPPQAGPQATQAPGQPAAPQEMKSVMLRFLTVDEQGRKQLSVGHLGDTRITADLKTNTVVVSAPADSLELIAALIAQLDQRNAVPAQIKVFTLLNGDATSMVTMLEDLFQVSGGSAIAAGGQAGPPQVTAEEGAGVPLRFSVDARTNSIIASGSASDLVVVEAILLRLDDSDVRDRRSVVYKLKNAPALDVALALNEYLQKERQTQQTAPGLMSPFEKIEREVVVVPEIVTNSLIVSATPRFYEEIDKIVKQLDMRAPMVMIQVLIAQVTLNNTDEFGIEAGLQNSVMFDRGLLSNFSLISSSSTQAVAGGGTITANNQTIVGANNTPGFDFNNATLQTTNAAGTATTAGIVMPNSGSATSLSTAAALGNQALSNFGMGRVDNNLGYGGLVLSLSSNTVNFLLRALRERDRLDVLSRPQIMTLDNQPAYVQVGQSVPMLGGSTIGAVAATSSVQYRNVGIILAVTPRITPDGLVVMEIDAEKSALGPLAAGIPVGFGALGQVLRQPYVDITQAQTTISAMDGQTVVFGGLITQTNQTIQRRVPGLSEIPLFGRLFRYDYQNYAKAELLVIMTPHIVRNEGDADRVKRIEAGRISWCLSDVRKMHGEAGLRNKTDDWLDSEVPTIYPDMDPTGGTMGAEQVPPPPGMPNRPAPPAQRSSPRGSGPMIAPPQRTLPPPAAQGAGPRNELRIRGLAGAPARPGPAMQSAVPPRPVEQPRPTAAQPAMQQNVRPAQYQAPPGEARFEP